MNLLIQNLFQKFVSSFLKGLAAAMLACLGAFYATPIPQDDKGVAYVMALVMAGVHALISVLNRWKNFDITKVQLPK